MIKPHGLCCVCLMFSSPSALPCALRDWSVRVGVYRLPRLWLSVFSVLLVVVPLSPWHQFPTRIEPVPPRVEARRPYQWTAKELPLSGFERGGSSRWNNGGEWGQGIYLPRSPLLSEHRLLHFLGPVVFSTQLLSSEPMSSHDPFRDQGWCI